MGGEDLENDLECLAGRYFPPPVDTPTFVEDSSWSPIVDGQSYFAELSDHLDGVGSGDTVLVSGLELNPYIDLCGRSEHDAGYHPLGRQLVEAAARGADVRLLIAGRVIASSIPRSGLPFRDNARHADLLREMRVDATPEPPLRGRLLIDFSSSLLGSNHQKTVVIHRGGELTSYVSGIDLGDHRCDAAPHDRMRLHGDRWGWHDMAVRLRGRAAQRVWDIFRERWQEALTLPDVHWLPSLRRRRMLNPPGMLPAPPPAPAADPVPADGAAVRVLRSTYRRKLDVGLLFGRRDWDVVPPGGHQEIFTTLVTAIDAARRYVYIEDQYLEESVGGDRAFELYPHLRAAAARGIKVVLVGSGTRDPDDINIGGLDINRTLNGDLRAKLIDPLSPDARTNVAVHRIESCTVHAKLVLVDDVFANIGSANMFSRSMVGADTEMSAAVVTTTSLVRDLRVALWAEHLRTPVDGAVRSSLEDLDLALGIWRAQWLPAGVPATTWHRTDQPAGFAPTERVITLVGPR